MGERWLALQEMYLEKDTGIALIYIYILPLISIWTLSIILPVPLRRFFPAVRRESLELL